MSVLVIADHNNATTLPATFNAMTAAKELNMPITVLVAGFECESVANELANIDGVQEILLADHLVYQHHFAERIADLVINGMTKYKVMMSPSTSFGKSLMPRIAAMLDVGQISDVIKIEAGNKYKRPIYAGNAIAEVQSQDDIQILTVRATAFEPAKQGKNNARISKCDFVSSKQTPEFIGIEAHSTGDRPDLASAEIVISGGRGLQSKQVFEALTEIADKMHAAMGASRAAVDAGLAPNDWQVGQTGQIVAPKLYFAVGISGAIQHLAGMKDSKIIVAINKDPDAPIFQVADYGIVDDLNKVLAEWKEALN